MNSKNYKLLFVVLSLIISQACNEPLQTDNGQSTSPLECLSFYDTTFGIYAMTHWDTDHNGCMTPTEAEQVKALPANAFANNTSLHSLEDMNSFPNLTVIGNNAFAGCTNITAADLPHVTTVGNGAFSGCTNLSAVNLPNAVSIAKDAFEGCPKLTTPEPPNDNACTDGFRKCSDNKQEAWLCQNGKWIAAETCANSCANGHCIPDAPTQACTNGALKCSDDNTAVQICKNARWITLTDCPNGCTNGLCNGKPEKTCTEGEIKCSQDNTHTLTCTDNQWITQSDCPNGCTNGSCNENPCTESEIKCSQDNMHTLICTDNQWMLKEKCPYGCNAGTCFSEAQICTTGKIKCSDDQSQTLICRNNQWKTKDTCTEGCGNGICQSKTHECVNGSMKCSDDHKQSMICLYHKWIPFQDCKDYCDDDYQQCVETCDDNYQDHCFGNSNDEYDDIMTISTTDDKFVTCNKDHKVVQLECKYECKNNYNGNNECLECKDDDTKCGDNDTLYKCIDGQWNFVEQCTYGCNARRYYKNGSACNECKAGDVKCSDDGTKSLSCSKDSTYAPLKWYTDSCGENGCNLKTGKCIPSTPSNYHYTGDEMIYYSYGYTDEDDFEEIMYDYGNFETYIPGSESFEFIDLYSIDKDLYGLLDYLNMYGKASTWQDFCDQHDHRLAFKVDRNFDCLLPCTEDELGKTFTICKGSGVPYYHDSILHNYDPDLNYETYDRDTFVTEYACTFIDNQYVYAVKGGTTAYTCNNNETFLCNKMKKETYYSDFWGEYKERYNGCIDHSQCDTCENGCNQGKCICPSQCVYGCDATGKCKWPDDCPTSCTDGCFNEDHIFEEFWDGYDEDYNDIYKEYTKEDWNNNVTWHHSYKAKDACFNQYVCHNYCKTVTSTEFTPGCGETPPYCTYTLHYCPYQECDRWGYKVDTTNYDDVLAW